MATKTSSKSTANKRKSKAPPPKLDGAAMVDAPVEASGSSAREQNKAGPVLVATPSVRPAPTHDEIAFRAFELYQMRSYASGGELTDWLAAERELRAS